MNSVIRSTTILAVFCASLATSGTAVAQDRPDLPAPQTLSTPAPRLELSEIEWDFGTVWYNTPLTHEVLLTNAGDAPLKITRVKTSCGCTASKLDRETIAPGESVRMRVTYNSKKRRPRASTTVTILSNDPTRPAVTYRVKGEVKPCYRLTPELGISFGQPGRETAETRTVTIENVYEEKMFLKLAEVTGDAFDVSLKEVEPGMKYELSATATPSTKSGSSHATAVLATGLERVPEIRVPIRSIIAPRVRVSPPTLVVPKTYPKRSTRILRVHWLPGDPVEVLSVESQHPGIEAELLPATPANGRDPTVQQIRVSLPPGSGLPDEGVALKILTDAEEPEFAELDVVVTTNLRRPVSHAARSKATAIETTPVAPAPKPLRGSREAGDGASGQRR
jgi:hypothetical protein